MSRPSLAEALRRARGDERQPTPAPRIRPHVDSPVDRGPRDYRWLAADEWMAEFIRKVSDPHCRAYRRVMSERQPRPWDRRIHAATEYDDQTEHYLRFLHEQPAA